MILKTYSESPLESKLSFEERRKADGMVYLILTVIVLIMSILFSV